METNRGEEGLHLAPPCHLLAGGQALLDFGDQNTAQTSEWICWPETTDYSPQNPK